MHIAGVLVHIAARVVGMAKGNEFLVSSTLKDFVSGFGIQFEDRGNHSLDGGQKEVAPFFGHF